MRWTKKSSLQGGRVISCPTSTKPCRLGFLPPLPHQTFVCDESGVLTIASPSVAVKGGRSSLQPFSAVEVQYSRAFSDIYRTACGPNPGFSGSNPRSRVKGGGGVGPSPAPGANPAGTAARVFGRPIGPFSLSPVHPCHPSGEGFQTRPGVRRSIVHRPVLGPLGPQAARLPVTEISRPERQIPLQYQGCFKTDTLEPPGFIPRIL
jgi:hypothetical protein